MGSQRGSGDSAAVQGVTSSSFSSLSSKFCNVQMASDLASSFGDTHLTSAPAPHAAAASQRAPSDDKPHGLNAADSEKKGGERPPSVEPAEVASDNASMVDDEGSPGLGGRAAGGTDSSDRYEDDFDRESLQSEGGGGSGSNDAAVPAHHGAGAAEKSGGGARAREGREEWQRERDKARMQRAVQLEQELEAAKMVAADKASAASEEAARQQAILEEEVRFWKIEALRVASEHDSVHQHLERLVNRRPGGACVPISVPLSCVAPAAGSEARRAESGEVPGVTAERGLMFGPVGAGFVKDAQTRALLDSRAPLHEATRQVAAMRRASFDATRTGCSVLVLFFPGIMLCDARDIC